MTILFFELASVASTISFDPSEFGKGARPLGMGAAYVALADDANALFLNPAGLGTISDRQATSMYATVYNDIRYLVLGAIEPLPSGNFGFGYIDIFSPPTPITEFIGNDEIYLGDLTQNNRLIYLSFSRKLRENLFVGTSLKYFNYSLTGVATYEQGGAGMDLDLGLKFLPKPWLALGLSLQNTLPASLGGKFNWSDGTSDTIPARFIFGTALRLLGQQGLREDKSKQLNFTADYEYNRITSNAMRFGVEFWPVYAFGLRMGLDSSRLALGAGFRNKGITFDYAYNVMEGVGNVAHSFSLGYLGEEEKEEFTSLSKEEVKPNEHKLKYFSDVPEKYFARKEISKVAALNVVNGYPDNTFRPEKEVTRAELALILVRALDIKSPEVNGRFIKDLPPDYWAAPYAKVALKQGLMTAYEDDTFRPNWPVKLPEALVVMKHFDPSFDKVMEGEILTRGQLAYMLYYTDFFENKSKEVIWK